MNQQMKAAIVWAHAHNYPILIISRKVLWLTNYQCAEYDSEEDSVTWLNREYFFASLPK